MRDETETVHVVFGIGIAMVNGKAIVVPHGIRRIERLQRGHHRGFIRERAVKETVEHAPEVQAVRVFRIRAGRYAVSHNKRITQGV